MLLNHADTWIKREKGFAFFIACFCSSQCFKKTCDHIEKQTGLDLFEVLDDIQTLHDLGKCPFCGLPMNT
jgi:hypothetical protein